MFVLKFQIMSVHNLEISGKNLLDIVLQMPETEFNQFIEKAKKLRQKSAKSEWTKREIELIKKVNECVLSIEEQNRFDNLVKKRRAEKISPVELQELIDLTEKSENLNVERVKILLTLAKSKKISLDEVMKKLGINPPRTI